MATNTGIEWTDCTWNVVTGCNKVSEGCKFCYAEIMHKRQMSMNPDKYSRPFLDGAYPYEPALELPLHWKKPRMIFVNSMSDLFF
jgi:protein gp37